MVSTKLFSDIERFLRTGQGDFGSLALDLFHYQFERNKPYQAFCQAQGLAPKGVTSWAQIPVVPIGAFKSTELATFAVSQAAAVFESSATTTGTPSRHYIRDLRYYEISLKTSFATSALDESPPHPHPLPSATESLADARQSRSGGRERVGVRGGMPFLILTPSPGEAPHSSLVWMMEVVKRTWGGADSDYFIQRGRLDELRLAHTLEKAQADKQPIVLLGTTLAFLAFFDFLNSAKKTYHLPMGSRLMDTGGMKTQKRQITRAEFVAEVGRLLGAPEDRCINEYGMCELGSQFYGRGASTYLQGPPWVRTLIIDSLTGQPARPGQPGLLRHFDLANVDSVLAIQTEDVGIAEGDGFIFKGRDPNADLKGCSLATESFLH